MRCGTLEYVRRPLHPPLGHPGTTAALSVQPHQLTIPSLRVWVHWPATDRRRAEGKGLERRRLLGCDLQGNHTPEGEPDEVSDGLARREGPDALRQLGEALPTLGRF